MFRSFARLGSLLLVLSSATTSQAQVTQALATTARAKNALEFYEGGVGVPQQLIFLSSSIQLHFGTDVHRYKGLSNELALQLGWFDLGPLLPGHVELQPEETNRFHYGRFSITLNKISVRQCELLSHNKGLNSLFFSVELNGTQIYRDKSDHTAVCETEWFFQAGKNKIKYVSY